MAYGWRIGAAAALGLGLSAGPAGAQFMHIPAPPPDITNTVHLLAVKAGPAAGAMSFIGSPRHHVTFDKINTWWRLKTFIDTRTGAVTHHLLMDVWYGGVGVRGFDAVRDDEGAALPFNKMSAGLETCGAFFFGGCIYDEKFWSPVSDAFLRRHMLTGFSVTVRDAAGEACDIAVTPAQVQSELITEDSVLRPGHPGMTAPDAAAAASPASAYAR